jgi:tripartite-type tricarboxylate transporter receptor subunit TctC
MTLWRSALVVVLALVIAAEVHAQDWPTRPITLIVPFATGGGVDVSARIQAQDMSELLGQPIIVENVGAAAGMEGSLRVAKAQPDGYTMLIGISGTHGFQPSALQDAAIQLRHRFHPGRAGDGIAAHPHCPQGSAGKQSSRVHRLCESQPGQHAVRIGWCRLGHAFALRAPRYGDGGDGDTRAYRGEGPAQQDLMGGRLDYMCSTIQTGAALAAQGMVKGIAVMSPHRVKIIPDLPTTGEQGLPGVEASVWNAFFLPPGAPDPIVRTLNRAMSDALDDATVSKRLEDLGLEIVAPERRTPEYLAKFVPEEVARWAKVIQAAGISPN